MSIYYIEDKHGDYCSENGKRRFVRLTGKDDYDYLSEHKDLRFYDTRTADQNGDTVYVETPKHLVKKVEA